MILDDLPERVVGLNGAERVLKSRNKPKQQSD